MNWVECLRCHSVWDEDDPNHEVCACLDRYGSREVVEIPLDEVQRNLVVPAEVERRD